MDKSKDEECEESHLHNLSCMFPKCDKDLLASIFELNDNDFEKTKQFVQLQIEGNQPQEDPLDQNEVYPSSEEEKEDSEEHEDDLEEESEEEPDEEIDQILEKFNKKDGAELPTAAGENPEEDEKETEELDDEIKNDIKNFYCDKFPFVKRIRIECIIISLYPNLELIEQSLEKKNNKVLKQQQEEGLIQDAPALKVESSTIPRHPGDKVVKDNWQGLSAEEIVNQKKRQRKLKKSQNKINDAIANNSPNQSLKDRDELFKCLRHFRDELKPEIYQAAWNIKQCHINRDFKSKKYWQKELKKLQIVYEQYRRQAIEIKIEANCSKEEGHILDLHSLTVDEALIALDQKLQSCYELINSERVVNPSAMIKLRVITGKGKHSKSKPVVKINTHKYLKQRRIRFKVTDGGGALVAFLK
ncbi:unnamed protein product [Moneuplotes crassus]|uniref:Smr domain-containing protein n=1 Tax=Euplotes crassus TaxID=5936 RepID=A0AAD1UE15_EUPCR|nr:unnamed protein product [Moneuplotes crassus]